MKTVFNIVLGLCALVLSLYLLCQYHGSYKL